MIFATFVLERDPLRWAELGQNVVSWAQDAGGFAACGLVIYFIYRLFAGRARGGIPPSSALKVLADVGLIGAFVGYGLYFGLQLPVTLAYLTAFFSGTPPKATA